MPANFFNPEGEFVVVQNMFNRVVTEGNRATWTFVRIDRLERKSNKWVEGYYWDEEEWQTAGTGAFEAILKSIARVVNNEEI